MMLSFLQKKNNINERLNKGNIVIQRNTKQMILTHVFLVIVNIVTVSLFFCVGIWSLVYYTKQLRKINSDLSENLIKLSERKKERDALIHKRTLETTLLDSNITKINEENTDLESYIKQSKDENHQLEKSISYINIQLDKRIKQYINLQNTNKENERRINELNEEVEQKSEMTVKALRFRFFDLQEDIHQLDLKLIKIIQENTNKRLEEENQVEMNQKLRIEMKDLQKEFEQFSKKLFD